MGRDLIREFVMMQNNRNRSISESDASAFVGIKDIIDKKNAGTNTGNATQFVENEMHKADADEPVDYKVISVDSDDFDVMSNAFETENSLENVNYTSLSEIEGSLSTAPRRLYEREVSNESLNMSIQEANNLASFEAKFDRRVEAIWHNCDDDKFVQPTKPNNVESLKSFWFNYYKHHYNTDHQHDSQSLLSLASDENDPGHHQTVDFESTNKLLPPFFNKCNDLRFCGVSIAVNSSQPLQSAIKPNSIWSSKAECEDDGSFYANAMWNSAAAAAENLMQPSQMASVDSQLNDFGASKTKESGCYNNYDLPSISKWSDCTFEIPFVPPSSSSTSSTTNLSIHQDLSANTEDKIRRDLLENSYFYDLKSLPVMNNFKQTDDQFQATRLGPQLNTHFYQPFFATDRVTDIYPANDKAAQMARPSSNVTLTNHSKDSKFVEVKSSTAATYNSSNRVNYADQMNLHDGRVIIPRQVATPRVDDENLLTSERTHFRPIVKYQDGHTFDIPDTLDEVKFSRSECGAIYLNAEKYMEFNAHGVNDDEFLVKFCIKQNNKYCQTDVASLDLFSFHDRSGYACDQSASDSTDLNDREDDFNSSFGSSEEIDTYNKANLDLENWTMGNSGRKCSRNENAHSLWEHCSGCSCDIASKPANQMMIEELCADGDQIMSDLRCMYIGSDWDDDDDDEEELDEDEVDGSSARGVHKEDDEEVVTVEPNNLLFNVSKLISDLLKPEAAQSLVPNNNFANISNRCVGGLWGNNDNNIWQRDLRPSTDNCVWSNYGVHNNNSVVRDSTNSEHSNLERIWNSDEDLSPETIEIYDKSKSNADANEPIEDDYVFDLIETHELAIDNEALKRYIDFNRTFNGNTGNDTGNDDGFMSLHSNLNRCDRKRRHSASQSISEALVAMIGEGADRKLASMFDDELNVTTIITCNYWTTDTSSYISGKTAALEIHPSSSILKHIPMVSRPLTR